jgi:hypothetical protein
VGQIPMSPRLGMWDSADCTALPGSSESWLRVERHQIMLEAMNEKDHSTMVFCLAFFMTMDVTGFSLATQGEPTVFSKGQ